jgi:hypothetical protein
MTERPLKCGIAGYGYMGEIRRAVIERTEGLELVGIAENSPAVRAKIKNISKSHWTLFLSARLTVILLKSVLKP